MMMMVSFVFTVMISSSELSICEMKGWEGIVVSFSMLGRTRGEASLTDACLVAWYGKHPAGKKLTIFRSFVVVQFDKYIYCINIGLYLHFTLIH